MALIDPMVPGVDGIAVARKLRHLPLRPLLVALTAYDGEDFRRRAKEAGFQLYLLKPVDPDVLTDIISLGEVDRGPRQQPTA